MGALSFHFYFFNYVDSPFGKLLTKNMFESSFHKIFGNYFLNNIVFRVKSFTVLNVHVLSFF